MFLLTDSDTVTMETPIREAFLEEYYYIFEEIGRCAILKYI